MAMKIDTPIVGEIEFEESSVLHFKEGMLGMPNFKRFLLLDFENLRPLYRLQCVDEPTLSFLLIDPDFVDPKLKEYVHKRDPDESVYEINDNCALFAVCKINESSGEITANLVAPVVINYNKMEGNQVILLDSPFDVRHSLTQMSERKEA